MDFVRDNASSATADMPADLVSLDPHIVVAGAFTNFWRYAVVAPDRQTVYVIDEGKSNAATGLRGQLLRLYSSSQQVDTLFRVR